MINKLLELDVRVGLRAIVESYLERVVDVTGSIKNTIFALEAVLQMPEFAIKEFIDDILEHWIISVEADPVASAFYQLPATFDYQIQAGAIRRWHKLSFGVMEVFWLTVFCDVILRKYNPALDKLVDEEQGGLNQKYLNIANGWAVSAPVITDPMKITDHDRACSDFIRIIQYTAKDLREITTQFG